MTQKPRALRRDSPQGLAYELAQQLRSDIALGSLAPGQRVPTEAELCETYGVSRTVVREAVSSLRAAGLVETFQGRGSFILAAPVASDGGSGGQIGDPIEVMELRLAIECEGAALAAARRTETDLAGVDRALSQLTRAIESGEGVVEADFDFHLRIARASGNALIVKALADLGPQSILRHRASLDAEEADLTAASHGARLVAEHEAVRDAVSRADVEAARAAMRVHLARSLDLLRSGRHAGAGTRGGPE